MTSILTWNYGIDDQLIEIELISEFICISLIVTELVVGDEKETMERVEVCLQ